MGRVPARCVLLLEDLDAAFVRSTNREDDTVGVAMHGQVVVLEIQGEVEITEMDWIFCLVPLV